MQFKDPINLYHAEQHILSEPSDRVSIRKLPREPFSLYGGEETMHL